MKTHQRLLARAGAATTALLAPLAVFAQAGVNPFRTAQNQIGAIGTSAGINATQTLPQIVGSIINIALGFIGILLLGYLLYAGFLWMTAGGSEDKVESAKTMIKNAIIGLIVIVAAFAISNFVVQSLTNVAGT